MATHNQKNVEKVHREVGSYVSRFIRTIADISSAVHVEQAAERTPEMVTADRTFAQIVFDDALEAFENIVADVRRHVPEAKNSDASITIYQQLMNARHGNVKKVTLPEAQAALESAVQEKLSSPIIRSHGAPAFYNVLNERVDPVITGEIVEKWGELIDNMSQLFLNEEAIVAENTTIAMHVALQSQFNDASGSDETYRVIPIDDDMDARPETVAMARSYDGANGGLPALSGLPSQLQALLIQTAGGEDITDIARRKKAEPVFGRVAEVQSMVEILLQKGAPHVLLRGPSGIGMTSAVRGLADRIVKGDVPNKLKNAHVLSVDLAHLVLTHSQQALGVLGLIIDSVVEHNRKNPRPVILHVGETGGDIDYADLRMKQFAPMLRAAVAHAAKRHKEHLSLIFETSDQHLDSLKSADPGAVKNFTAVEIKPLPEQDVINCLRHHSADLTAHHGVVLQEGALEFLAVKTNAMVGHQPAKSIAIMKKTFAAAEANGKKEIDPDFIEGVLQAAAGVEDEVGRLARKAGQMNLSDEARAKLDKTFQHLERLNPQSQEYATYFNYADHVLGLPWGKYSEVNRDLNRAQEILDEDHYGLAKVKDAIIERLAVKVRTANANGKTVCLVGPPGVGKTSLGKSVARAMGLVFQRLALGGIHDEAEIRGHRPTYVGAMPGRIIDTMKQAGTANPFILLDEIDKLSGMTIQGDPSAALLEVLDPAQNHTFKDNYLGISYDLSKVSFFCTANYEDQIPPALKDRMEVIRLPGYNKEEKLEIAKRYLVPKQMKEASLTAENFSVDEAALKLLVDQYTREPGVRQLEREIGRLCGKTAKEIQQGKIQGLSVTTENLEKYAGKPKIRPSVIEAEDRVGIINGLAYTPAGGDTLPIEAVAIDLGKSSGFHLKATGQLGDVMKESVSAAATLMRSRATAFGIDPKILDSTEVHVHALEGAVPKDGPSAGAAITTVVISALTGIPIRRDIAMTGEISMHGKVLPIGGLPEKLQGALDAGVTLVLVPKDNERDLEEVPASIRNALDIKLVSSIDEVLGHALTRQVIPFIAPPAAKRESKGMLASLSAYASEFFSGLRASRSNDNRIDPPEAQQKARRNAAPANGPG